MTSVYFCNTYSEYNIVVQARFQAKRGRSEDISNPKADLEFPTEKHYYI